MATFTQTFTDALPFTSPPRRSKKQFGPKDGDSARKAAEVRLSQLAWLLDDLIEIPGIKKRVGLDVLLGLAPGKWGKIASAAVSTFILAEAARAGVPKHVLARMGGNIALEGVLTSIPLVGRVFDATFKSNRRNVRLFHKHVRRSDRRRRWLVAGSLGMVAVWVASIGWVIMRLR